MQPPNSNVLGATEMWSNSDLAWQVLTELSRDIDDPNPLNRWACRMVLWGLLGLIAGPFLFILILCFSFLIVSVLRFWRFGGILIIYL